MKGENQIKAFRMLMAEEGMEMTPEQARQAYKMSRSIVKRSRAMSMIDIWNMEESVIEGTSEEEKANLIEIYKSAKEL